MSDENKTKVELLREMTAMRQRIAELEHLDAGRKETVNALEESATNFRAFFDTIDNFLFILDSQARILDVNQTVIDRLGYTLSELRNESVLFVHPEERWEEAEKIVGEMLKGERKSCPVPLRTKTGEEIPVETQVTFGTWNEKPAVFGVCKDISELKQSEEKFRLVYENMAVGVAQVSMDFRIQAANTAYCQMLGYSEDGLIGKHLQDITHPDIIEKNLQKQEQLALGEIDHYRMEKRFIHKGGRIIYGILDANLVRDIDGQPSYFLGSVVDITERKQAEDKVVQYIKRLDSLRKIDQTIINSFDLRVTLSVILDHVLSHLHVDAADVLKHDEPAQSLVFVQGQGFRTKVLQQTNLRLGHGYAGKVALDRRSVFVPDLQEESFSLLNSLEFNAEEFRSYYSVPLVAKGALVGVLEIFHRSLLKPDNEWVKYLEMLAGQAAIAIDNIALFENLERSNIKLLQAYDATIEGWARVLELRDLETEGHSRRVVKITIALARSLGIAVGDLPHVRRGALLHDIGKMGIPDHILQKPGKLTKDEWDVMKTHPGLAHQWLSSIDYLRPALDIPYCHHERWDGTGYPRGLKGDQIPLAVRIFTVADVWDALCSDRPYRKAWTEEKALSCIRKKIGTHFDPRVATVFLKYIEEESGQ